jgi:oxygen-dependent protoporphyrinogen oxidase
MNARIDTVERKRVAIIGGGISGLTSAFYLLKSAGKKGIELEVTLVDESRSLGGVFKSASYDGLRLDLGPECFVTGKPAVLDLANELGIGSTILRQSTRRTFIARGSFLSKIPDGLFALTPNLKDMATSDLFSWTGKIRMALEPFVQKQERLTDESVATFIERRFGKELLQRLAEPMIGGLYGIEPENLSAQMTLPYMRSLEKEHGSVIKGIIQKTVKRHSETGGWFTSPPSCKGTMATFDEGMTALTQMLEKCVQSKCKVIEAHADSIEPVNEGKTWKTRLSNGLQIDSDAVVVALPAKSAGRTLLQTDKWLSECLQSINYSSPIVVSLVFEKSAFKSAPHGSGFLVAGDTRKSVRACTFSSSKFKRRNYQNKVVLRVSVDSTKYRESSDEQIKIAVLEDLSRFIEITGEPLFCAVARHNEAIPQFAPRHGHLLKEIELRKNRFASLALVGNAYGAIGVADCITRAKEESQRIADCLFSVVNP